MLILCIPKGDKTISIFKEIKNWFSRKPLYLDWIQVEVTSFCNAHCVYCPRTIYKDIWSNIHLDIATFSNITPILNTTKLVYLQGWGEPFMNPLLFDMIRISKSHGCMVGITSNATLIDLRTIKRLIEAEVDIIALSLTGSPEKNDIVRKGTSSQQVLSILDEFKTQKALFGSERPFVNIAYLLLSNEIEGLYKTIDRLENSGVNQIIVSGLDFVASDNLLHFADYTGFSLDICNQIKQYAKQRGLSLITNLYTKTTPNPVCTENVKRAIYISSDGTVSPCVFMNLPIKTDVAYQSITPPNYSRQIFGSIKSSSLKDIWYSEGYLSFRKGFEDKEYSPMCIRCPKLYIERI